MAMSGELGEVDLVNVIELARQSGAPARLVIQRGELSADIYLESGEVVHAQLQERAGKEVLFEILQWHEGHFELGVGQTAPEHSIVASWSSLLLESLQRIDEGTTDTWPGLDDLFSDSDSQIPEEGTHMAKLDDLLKEMAQEIGGFVSADVAGMDGLSLAHHSADPDFNAEKAVAQFALVMKLVQKTSGQLDAGELEDNLVTTENSYIVTRFLGDGSYYLGVAVDKDLASLGNLRLVTREFASDLWDAIPKRK